MEAFTEKRVTRKPFTYNMCYCVRVYIAKIKVFNRVALVRKNLPQQISIHIVFHTFILYSYIHK